MDIKKHLNGKFPDLFKCPNRNICALNKKTLEECYFILKEVEVTLNDGNEYIEASQICANCIAHSIKNKIQCERLKNELNRLRREQSSHGQSK